MESPNINLRIMRYEIERERREEVSTDQKKLFITLVDLVD